MSRPIVYLTDASPPSRSVRLAAAAMGLDIEVRRINLLNGEHLTKEFRKMNPQHTVPTLVDGGVCLSDSHAIMCYLVDKYAKDDTLYPKDLHRRALVNQRLYFECGVLFPPMRLIAIPLFKGLTDTVAPEKIELVKESFEHLNNFLDGQKWLAGDSYTLADISCVSSVSSIEFIVPLDGYPNLQAWLKRCKETLPGYEDIETPGRKIFQDVVGSKLASKGKL